MPIKLKRAYDPPAPADGFRILVDRLWPRGVSKDSAAIDLWMKEIAPTTPLRKWFGHDPAKWTSFRTRYFRELDERTDMIADLRERARHHTVTLVYAAKDEKHNHALVLQKYLDGHVE